MSPMAEHKWSEDPDFPEEGDYIPQHFTLGCIGCDADAEPDEEDDFDDWCEVCDNGGMEQHECPQRPDEPAPLEITLKTDWCIVCRRRIDPMGWLTEHMDRFLWKTDEMIATAVMIKERMNSPELNAYIDQRLQEAGDYVIAEFDAVIAKIAADNR